MEAARFAFWANRRRGDARGGRSGNAAERRCTAATGRRRLPGVRRRGRGRGLSARGTIVIELAADLICSFCDAYRQ